MSIPMTQDEALDLLKLGANVFLTGPAGSGKTYVLNKYLKYLQSHKVEPGITASTGIAATHLSGMTIHSWSGIGIKDSLTPKDLTQLSDKIHLRTRMFNTKVLVIDEISMLHAVRLDMVDQVCRLFKDKHKPFGGIQVILCGDFFQLPPVSRGDEQNDFAYKSAVWNEMNLHICYLEEQFRQSDNSFLKVLHAIRSNKVSQDSLDLLMSRHNAPVHGFDTPTKLYTHNLDVDAINTAELTKIPAESKTFLMTHGGKRELVDFLTKSCLAPEVLALKKGAAVMFVKNNYEKGYVNGTLGTVIDFNSDGYPIVETFDEKEIVASPETWVIEEEGIVKAEIAQIPLRLAWAITIHKSQGMSLDAAIIDLSKSFVPGMGYVALSRVRSLAGMKLVGFNQMALRVNPEVSAIDSLFQKSSEQSQDQVIQMGREKKIKIQEQFLSSIARK
jgi:ATP-dependent exoDNAse (exonuclease V) alpha subunit